MSFEYHDRIVVTGGHQAALDREFVGRHGVFLEYTKPHGWARVQLDGELPNTVILHPEALEKEQPT